jgi:hypothetical protein
MSVAFSIEGNSGMDRVRARRRQRLG